MKNFDFLLSVSVFLGLCLYSCKPTEVKEKAVAYTVLYSGSFSGDIQPYYQVVRDSATFSEILSKTGLWGEISDPDFSSRQVLAVFDMTRTHPTYKMEVSSVKETGEAIQVEVSRKLSPRSGRFDQAFVLVEMPRMEKEVRFTDLPYSEEDLSNYEPRLGVSSCLDMIAGNNAAYEYLWYRFTDEGKLLLEHQGMELNCGPTEVETSVNWNGDILVIEEKEVLGRDSIMAPCVCAKNVGYMADVAPKNDSIEVDFRFTTFDRGLRTRSFKISGKGSGSIVIGKRLR